MGEKVDLANVGRYARVMFEEVGVRDGVIVGIDKYGTGYQWFELGSEGSIDVEPDQVVQVGNLLTAKDSGLPLLGREDA